LKGGGAAFERRPAQLEGKKSAVFPRASSLPPARLL